MPWRPILDGPDAARARGEIARIAASLVDRPDVTDPSLIRGWAGIALLHGYLARDGDPDAGDRAYQALARALELVSTQQPRPWLGTGFMGVAWVLHHLADVVDADEDTLAQLDGMATDLLGRDTWPYEYELWEGVVGLGVYALERGRHDDVERAIHHLEALAETTPHGITWWNRDFLDFTRPGADPRGYHNVGLALGVAGVASFLAEAVATGVVPDRAGALLTGAVTWIRSLERRDAPHRFPMFVGPVVPETAPKNGWCYGDAAIGCVLVRAGTVAGDPSWVSLGRELGHALARGPVDDVPFVDAAFCHGTAGRAHLLNRLGQALDDAELLDAARRYYVETLARIADADLTQPNLTTGSSGIALALLAAVAPRAPDWDRLFLVSLPPVQISCSPP